jgi:hypothetical protein
MKDKNQLQDDEFAPVKAYTSEELRALYQVARSTWYRWMRKHRPKVGKPEGRYYSNKQVRIIFGILDPPSKQEEGKVLVRI